MEYGVRAAASIAARALAENRNVGMTAAGIKTGVIPADRGPRQYQKVMQLLAAVTPNGDRPLGDVLIEGVGRLKRGMSAIVITPSLNREWVRPLNGLRGRGVVTVVILLDAPAFAAAERRDAGLPEPDDESAAAEQRSARAIRHALAEHDLNWHNILPGEPISAQLVTASARPVLVRQ
jgi:uncharacterized protein (DUF58 family)